eukprot:1719493-Amphidinium_carterae.1
MVAAPTMVSAGRRCALVQSEQILVCNEALDSVCSLVFVGKRQARLLPSEHSESYAPLAKWYTTLWTATLAINDCIIWPAIEIAANKRPVTSSVGLMPLSGPSSRARSPVDSDHRQWKKEVFSLLLLRCGP